jgi:hypothetical protein
MFTNTVVRILYMLGLRVRAALHRADYFSLGVRVYEGTAIDVIVCQVSHDIWNSCNNICSLL